MQNPSNQQPALAAGFGAFVLWGILPVYWKLFDGIHWSAIVCHRIVWSLVFLLLVATMQGSLKQLWKLAKDRRAWLGCSIAGVLIATNWTLFIWSVQNGHVVEASLGYFLNPLCNVVLAVLIIGERINGMQKLAIGLAAIAIIIASQTQSDFPWIAVALAMSFSFYSLTKKLMKLPAVTGLTLETAVLAPLAAGWLMFGDQSSISELTTWQWILVVSSGPVTVIPLFMFAYAAQRVSFITIGMLQYIGPTLQLLVGWLVYQESMPSSRWFAFIMIWISLGIYTYDMIQVRRTALREV
jgi:chloramphenicol-sensitive protein RarD